MKHSQEDPEALDPEMRETQRQLDLAAQEQKEVLEAARRQADEADLRFVEAALETAASASVSRQGPRRLAWLVPLAAAAILVLFLLGRDEETEPGPGDVLLNGESLQILAPAGEGATFGTIRWNYGKLLGTTFELRVFDASGENVLFETVVEEVDSFDVPLSQALGWPDSVRIELEAFDADGILLDSTSSSASR